jgi:hypothetical protein
VDIESLVIGPLYLTEFVPNCSEADTVVFHFELSVASDSNGFDPHWDFASQPRAVSPEIHIPWDGTYYNERLYPYAPCTPRTFFASLSRPQGNGWDDFVNEINALQPNARYFILRIVPDSSSGVLLADQTYLWNTPALWYSQNLQLETDLLDSGDVRISYLTPQAALSYHGLVLRGRWSREWGMNADIILNYINHWGDEIFLKAIALPFRDNVLHGDFAIAIDSSFWQQHRVFTIEGYSEQYFNWEFAACRADSLRLYYQP